VTRHHDLMAAAVTDHRGVVFETVGDAVYAAFAHPADGVRAAIVAQRAMQTEPWGDLGDVRVRIAVHLGPVERRGAHYVGPALYRASRVLALGHGGQTLVSAELADAVAGIDGFTLRPMGRHRLKDLTDPEPVFQVDADGLPSSFPPLRSMDARLDGIPRSPAPLVGRSADVAELVDLLGRERLVTLVGPGGIGKTRFATAAAAALLDARTERFLGGAQFVDLALVTAPADVPGAIAAALALRPLGDETVEALLYRWLAERRLLLVLDNWEHVIEAAPLVPRLLDAAPRLAVLATSRERLRVRGERVIEVAPLAVTSDDGISVAARLFCEVAGLDHAALSTSDRGAVEDIATRLAGLPLAIKLAASQTASRTPSELLRRLDRGIGALKGGPRDLPGRQRTIDATIDWSIRLLGDDERVLFERLGVFVGGFLAPSAAAGCAPLPGGTDPLDALDGLVDRSLVRAPVADAPEPRYRMLEPIRETAVARLAAREDAREVRGRHLAWALDLAAVGGKVADSPASASWLLRLDAEFADLTAARAHALAAGDRVAKARFVANLWRLGYVVDPHLATLLAWAADAAAAADALEPVLTGRVLLADGGLCHYSGEDGRRWRTSLARARERLEPLGPSGLLAEVDYTWTVLATEAGELSAEAQIERYDATVMMLRGLDEEQRLAIALSNRADTQLRLGRTEGLIDDLRFAVDILRRTGTQSMVRFALENLALAQIAVDDLGGAASSTLEGIALRATGPLPSASHDIGSLLVAAGILARDGDAQTAGRLLGAARGLIRRTGRGESLSPEVAAARDQVETLTGIDIGLSLIEGETLGGDEAFAIAVSALGRIAGAGAMP
jgi:predicted ATPase